MIYKQEPLKKVLRLLCIQCIAADGLKPKVLGEIFNVYLSSAVAEIIAYFFMN